jgi:hypothetical protein
MTTAFSTISQLVRSTAIAAMAAYLAAGAAAARTPADETATSAQLVTELVKLLTDKGLNAYAVEDPARPEHFVAVLAYPGVQLLVASARSTSTDYLKWQIAHKQYAEAYSALNGSAVPATKVFFQDLGCDGLTADGAQVDVMYERAAHQVLFDGNGKSSGLSKAEYAKKRAAAEAQYSTMLSMLLESLRASAAPGVDGSALAPAVQAPGQS